MNCFTVLFHRALCKKQQQNHLTTWEFASWKGFCEKRNLVLSALLICIVIRDYSAEAKLIEFLRNASSVIKSLWGRATKIRKQWKVPTADAADKQSIFGMLSPFELTHHFLYGLPTFSIMLGVFHEAQHIHGHTARFDLMSSSTQPFDDARKKIKIMTTHRPVWGRN